MSPLLQHLLLGLLKDEEEYSGVQWDQPIQEDNLGSHLGWQNWRGSISGMLSSELLTGQHGLLCKCGGNNNKNWFCQNRKIIRTIPALQKRYLGEVNCIGGGLKACANCTQKSISKRSRATSPRISPSCLTSISSVPPPGGHFLPQLLTNTGRGPILPHRKTSLCAAGAGRDIQEQSGDLWDCSTNDGLNHSLEEK